MVQKSHPFTTQFCATLCICTNLEWLGHTRGLVAILGHLLWWIQVCFERRFRWVSVVSLKERGGSNHRQCHESAQPKRIGYGLSNGSGVHHSEWHWATVSNWRHNGSVQVHASARGVSPFDITLTINSFLLSGSSTTKCSRMWIWKPLVDLLTRRQPKAHCSRHPELAQGPQHLCPQVTVEVSGC